MITIRQFWSRLPAKARVIEKKSKQIESNIECRRRFKINQINKGGPARSKVIKNAYNHIFTQRERLKRISSEKEIKSFNKMKATDINNPLHSEIMATKKAFTLQTQKTKTLKYQHPLRPLVEDIFRERKLSKIGEMIDTPNEKISKLISLKTIGNVYGNDINNDNDNDNDNNNETKTPLLQAREILKEQRKRAKEAPPIETKIEFINGLRHFFPFCQRIHITYSSSTISSSFLEYCRNGHMIRLIEENPLVHFSIQPHQGHLGMIRAFYQGGFERQYPLENVNESSKSSFSSLFKRLLDCSGRKDRKFKAGVISSSPSIRPLWSPFHSDGSANSGNLGRILTSPTKNSPLIGANKKKVLK